VISLSSCIFFSRETDVFWTQRDSRFGTKKNTHERRKEQKNKERAKARKRKRLYAHESSFVRSFVMTRYYCEYCDAYLTHDSATVRRQHISGFKHKANVRNYYLQFMNNNTACGPAQQQQGAQLGPAAGMPTGANQMMPPMGPPMTMGQQQPQQNAMPPPKY